MITLKQLNEIIRDDYGLFIWCDTVNLLAFIIDGGDHKIRSYRYNAAGELSYLSVSEAVGTSSPLVLTGDASSMILFAGAYRIKMFTYDSEGIITYRVQESNASRSTRGSSPFITLDTTNKIMFCNDYNNPTPGAKTLISYRYDPVGYSLTALDTEGTNISGMVWCDPVNMLVFALSDVTGGNYTINSYAYTIDGLLTYKSTTLITGAYQIWGITGDGGCRTIFIRLLDNNKPRAIVYETDGTMRQATTSIYEDTYSKSILFTKSTDSGSWVMSTGTIFDIFKFNAEAETIELNNSFTPEGEGDISVDCFFFDFTLNLLFVISSNGEYKVTVLLARDYDFGFHILEEEGEPVPVPVLRTSSRMSLQVTFKVQSKYGALVLTEQITIPPLGTVQEEEAKNYYNKEKTDPCDLRLGSTHDLLIVNNDFDIVYNIDKVRQNLKIRLQSFINDWFLDIRDGINFYGIVFVKEPDMNLIDGVIKTVIMETDDIIEILEYNSQLQRI